jgi:hypothetical protein
MAFLRGVLARAKRFFTGCYGGDHLSMTMTYAALVLILMGAFPRLEVLLAVAYALVIWSFFRMFSRNVKARRRENDWFLRKTAPIADRLYRVRTRLTRKAAPHVTRFYQARALLQKPQGLAVLPRPRLPRVAQAAARGRECIRHLRPLRPGNPQNRVARRVLADRYTFRQFCQVTATPAFCIMVSEGGGVF